MGEFGIGQSVRRKEDDRLIVGRGRYIDDISLAGQAHGYVLRSPHAHARILSVDTAAARAMPGVLAVYLGGDVSEIGPLPCMVDSMIKLTRRDGSPRLFPAHHVLARTHVRHVGDPVAFVVAETRHQAKDAAEAIVVDYDLLASVTDTESAVAAAAPVIYADLGAKDNQAFFFTLGDKAKSDEAFAKAAHVVEFRHVNQRLVAASMEPRGAIGEFDPKTDRFTLHTNTQSVYRNRTVCAAMLGIAERKIRVLAPDIGGSFGMKGMPYPEQPLVLWAAKRLGRPVKWYSDRSEAFLSDTQGRDLVVRAKLALDADGRFLGVRVDNIGTIGAYASNFGPMILSAGAMRLLPGVYTVPSVYGEANIALTNKVFTDAYRGAGRPEASYVIERLVDLAARKLRLSPAEIRRRNLIRPEQMPFTGATGLVYDSGNFGKNLDDCLKLGDWSGIDARKAASQARGKLRGIGLSVYVEQTPGGAAESGRIEVAGDGSLTVLVGALAQGQGHETTFAQVAAERLGVAFDLVTVVEGDSDRLPTGGGTGGSKSGYSAGGAVAESAQKIIAKGTKIAAHLLEAADADIEFREGYFTIAGTDRRLSLAEVARAASDPEKLPPGVGPGLVEDAAFTPGATFPNGCHVCEVEIDPDTGGVHIDRYSVVDDFGNVLNPMIVHGQVHGGIAQGVGQALCEETVYDRESGQLVTGSFMDYCMPRADILPSIQIETNVIPCKTNPLGMKGAGESGTTGATGAVINAVLDALAPLGVTHIEMPASPQRVWQAIQAAKSRTIA
ncbi:MAG: xanthine dehydrogenase family protein molybdopterin-binding subunit [Alphaproteobacteria bacterium]|nr:xanthine dehydrogenase family protein molybdopterin-binding subunit [Alphaproteobacteria bacterium]